MGRMSDLMIQIQDDLANGLSFEEIAKRNEVPISWVSEAADMAEEFNDDGYDDSMDGDHASALASAGWGTDEDYVIENDYFDDY